MSAGRSWGFGQSGQSASPAGNTSLSAWPKPKPLQELPPVKPFLPDFLPGYLRKWAEDVSRRLKMPLECPAVAALVPTAGAVGARVRAQPKLNDDTWRVSANQWGGIVADAGRMKTAVLKAGMEGANKIQAEWNQSYDATLAQHKLAKLTYEQALAWWKKQDLAARKQGKPLPAPPVEPDEPVRAVLVINDVTVQALYVVLRNNPAGVLYFREELVGWLEEFENEGHQGDRAFFLSCFDGGSPYSVGRIGRGDTMLIRSCCPYWVVFSQIL